MIIRFLRRICLAFLLLIGSLFIVFFGVQMYGFSPYGLPLAQPLGDSASSAKAWLDINQNGKWDQAEQPLAGVCIWSSVSPYAYDAAHCNSASSHTAGQGLWPGELHAGASSADIYIFAEPPSGFRPTTSLAAKGMYAEFGFAPNTMTPTKQLGTRFQFVAHDIRVDQTKTLISRVVTIAVAFLLVGFSVIGAIRLDRLLILKGLV